MTSIHALRLEWTDRSGWEVAWHDETGAPNIVRHLSWDEMLAQVAVLTVPEGPVQRRKLYNSEIPNPQTPCLNNT